MAESILTDTNAPKALRYEQLMPQLKALIGDDHKLIPVLSNCAAALNDTFRFHWVGFYIVEDQKLWLGPFQGPVACMSIDWGKGVCGSTAERGETIIVPDVDQFPGHIACSALSKSEIVVPVKAGSGEVRAVLDIDSDTLAAFDQVDQQYLEEICYWIGERVF